MNTNKDYYEILGVLPTIESEALRPIYLALLKKYHPDTFKGDKLIGEQKTKEINEAFEVLGNPEKRSIYDRDRKGHRSRSEDNESNNSSSASDWKIIIEYEPMIEKFRLDLESISPGLGDRFRTKILTEKAAKKAHKVHSAILNEYLTSFFGKNEVIRNFALTLLRNGNRAAASEINDYIRVVGCSNDADAYKLISKIKKKYDVSEKSKNDNTNHRSTHSNQAGHRTYQTESVSDGNFIKSFLFMIFIAACGAIGFAMLLASLK